MIKIQDTSTATPARVAREEAAVLKARLLRDIGAKWERFSEDDLALITNSETLIKRLVERYGVEQGEAHRNVRAFLNGRHF